MIWTVLDAYVTVPLLLFFWRSVGEIMLKLNREGGDVDGFWSKTTSL